MDWEKLSKALKIHNWVTLLILASVSFFLMSQAFTLGIIVGGLVIIGNFSLLQRTIRRSFFEGGVMRSNKMSIIAKYYLRLLVMGIIIYISITRGFVDPIGLTVGLSIVVISIIHIAIRTIWKMSSGEAI